MSFRNLAPRTGVPTSFLVSEEVRAAVKAIAKAEGVRMGDVFEQFLSAYGRAGEPCHRCGARLVGTHAIDGRQTVLCTHCQI